MAKHRIPETVFDSREGIQVLDSKSTGLPLTLKDIQDLAEDLVKAVWDCKDRISKAAKDCSVSGDAFKKQVIESRELCIVADLANAIKHGSWGRDLLSGMRPTINGTRIFQRFPNGATETKNGDWLIIEGLATDIEVFATVRDADKPQRPLADAFDLCELGLEQWKAIVRDL